MSQRGFIVLPEYEGVAILPQRQTAQSAGYDLHAVQTVVIPVGETVMIPTGLTAYMKKDEVLCLHIRSSLALKHGLSLANGVGIVDADYYGKHIQLLIKNGGDEPFPISAGDRIAQAVFGQFFVTDNDQPLKSYRLGGFGSTGRR